MPGQGRGEEAENEALSPALPQASCLCGSAPCILCSCCPCSHNSTLSRLIFTAFLFLGVLVSIIMLSPGVESQLYKVSRCGTWPLGEAPLPGLGPQLIQRWAGVSSTPVIQAWRWEGYFFMWGWV